MIYNIGNTTIDSNTFKHKLTNGFYLITVKEIVDLTDCSLKEAKELVDKVMCEELSLDLNRNKHSVLLRQSSEAEIDFRATPEKYHYMKDEIISFLLQNLKNICQLQEEICARNDQLEKEKIKLGISRNQLAPGSKELWEEYRNRYMALVTPICTELLLKQGVAGSISKPAKYSFSNTGCDKIVFTMKSQNRAVIEFYYYIVVVGQKHQFTLQNIEGKWKISMVKGGLINEPKWHPDII